jgi:hypothetical protein
MKDVKNIFTKLAAWGRNVVRAGAAADRVAAVLPRVWA